MTVHTFLIKLWLTIQEWHYSGCMWGRIHQFRVGRDDQATITLAAVLGFLVVEIATQTAISMAYIGGVFVAATVLIGSAAPLGSVAGLIIHDGFHGTIGY